MLCVKYFVIAVFFCLMAEKSQAIGTLRLRRSILYCGSFENPVYANDNDNSTCDLFRNVCHMIKHNHRRYRDNKSVLYLTTKANCLTKCDRTCSPVQNTVCGEYNGSYEYYNNEFELMKAACKNDQSIIKVPKTNCSVSHLYG